MPREAIEFSLNHIADTRDPMQTVYRHYVMMELAAGEGSAAGLREMVETVLAESMEDGLSLIHI